MDNTILSVTDIDIVFDNGKNVIVDKNKSNSIKVNAGEIVVLVGENGSGKSSIFRSILKLDQFSKKRSNEIGNANERKLEFLGEIVDTDEALTNFRRSIGYCAQEDDRDPFLNRSVSDYVNRDAMYSVTWNDEEKKKGNFIDYVYEKLGCSYYHKGSLKKTKLKKLSGGELRMVSILCALSRIHSKLYILDEPINNLDANHARLLNNYLVDCVNKEDKPAVLIITHCPMFACDRAYKLENGAIKEIENYQCNSCFGKMDKKTRKYVCNEKGEPIYD